MPEPAHPTLADNQAALWFLGQAGYIAQAGEVTLAIDPYLTDSVGKSAPLFSRRFPPPVEPEQLEVAIFVVTHDHTDHLDPETVARYQHRETTAFVAPRFAAAKLISLGVPEGNVTVVDIGETAEVRGVKITGAFALPTSADVLDTVGYRVEFANGRSFYHAGDTAFCERLLRAAPKAEVLLVAINGKWGNLDVDQAIALTEAVQPQFVIPNHYDVMALNSENPETFRHFYGQRKQPAECVVLEVMRPFVWG
jgi:L-ascorbate 6-phosphate lactonase